MIKSIDRKALVSRHNPVYTRPELKAPLSLGNGRFCFTVDFTGLQTFFPRYEYFPLCTMSEWGWHSYPDTGKNYSDFRLMPFDTWGREVGYAIDGSGQEELYNSLRQNPHKFNLGTLGFDLSPEKLEDCTSIYQTLNMWEGFIESAFTLWGEEVKTETLVSDAEDTVCLKLSSALFKNGRLRLCLKFPYASHTISGSDFSLPKKHESMATKISSDDTLSKNLIISRRMDDTKYMVQVIIDRDVSFSFDGEHGFFFESEKDSFCIIFRFFPNEINTDKEIFDVSAKEYFENTRKSTAAFWNDYWNRGGAIELSAENDSAAKDAHELERRMVISQYLMAIQNRGSLPPAETGLTCNSWYGKFHLEMHYWHSAHFPLWNRAEELEKSLVWYKKILPEAKKIARSQGYKGARWPKMCGPHGDNSPSPIAVLLVWQQPHPILMAELCYRQYSASTEKGRDFLEEYREIIVETADFMLDFIHWDGSRYVLGPPLIPAQERFDPCTVLNPGYEVEYFRWAFRQANIWLRRLGEKERDEYTEAADKLALPVTYEGVFPAHENCLDTFTKKPFNTDHPSMLGMLGLLPGEGINREVMNDTLDRVLRDWDLPSCWGWDFPMMAMCAARLGRREDAVRFLLMENTKNKYLSNGHNAQAERADLPLYLPGNGGLLLAAAMMAAGWDGDDQAQAPGFPETFNVKFECLNRYI